MMTEAIHLRTCGANDNLSLTFEFENGNIFRRVIDDPAEI